MKSGSAVMTTEREADEDNEVRRHVAETISSLNDDIEGWTSRQARTTPLSYIAAAIKRICLVVPQYAHIGGITSASRLSSVECRDLIDTGITDTKKDVHSASIKAYLPI